MKKVLTFIIILFLIGLIVSPFIKNSDIDVNNVNNDLAVNNKITDKNEPVNDGKDKETSTLIPTPTSSTNNINESNVKLDLRITIVDVGQADCIVIKSNDELMVIDAGNNADASLVIDYLKSEGVENIKYLIGTHPHEDHIGGLDSIINNYNIETIIMPNAIATTKTFEDVITAIENKNLEITAPIIGDSYKLGNAEFTIIAPNNDYDDLNNMSIGIKLINGENSFIFCGDAEVLSENDIVSNKINLQADVLKLSHHGSDTSTSEAFLKAVNPKWAIISVGKDNSYGHPHTETLQKLLDAKVELFRTDLQGSIIITSDGKNIEFNVEPLDINESIKNIEEKNTETKETTSVKETKSIDYILNKNTKKFHYPSCKSVKQMKDSNKTYFAGNRSDVINQGYDPCKNCNP